jgi:hypothetical protein
MITRRDLTIDSSPHERMSALGLALGARGSFYQAVVLDTLTAVLVKLRDIRSIEAHRLECPGSCSCDCCNCTNHFLSLDADVPTFVSAKKKSIVTPDSTPSAEGHLMRHFPWPLDRSVLLTHSQIVSSSGSGKLEGQMLQEEEDTSVAN